MIAPKPRVTPKLLRLPWRDRLTLCVAAECTQGNRNKVVFAKDFKVESGTASAEIEAKYTYISKSEFPALFAGTASRAIELADVLGQRFDDETIADEAIVDIARYGVRTLKSKVADEYIGALVGIEYERFLSEGSKILTPEKHRELMDEVTRLEIGCSMLWLGFDHKNDTHIVRINENGMVERCSHFAAIGSGLYIAEAALFQREQKNECSLGLTIYNVYEAMRLGACAPGVGEKFSLHIASFGSGDDTVRWEEITEDYYTFLESKFQRYGPKKVSAIPYKPRWVEQSEFT